MPKVTKERNKYDETGYKVLLIEPDPDVDYKMKVYEPGKKGLKDYKFKKEKEKRKKLNLQKIMQEILKKEKRLQKLKLADVMKT